MVTILTTDGLRPNEREAFWRHVMSDTIAPVAIHSMAAGNVAGSIDARWAGRLMIADVRSTGQDIRRTPRQINDADNAYVQVAVVADGVGRVSQDDRQAVLRPGDCVVYQTTRPFQWLFDSDWDVWVFSFPSEAIQLSESERRLMSAQRLDGSAGLTGVVSRFLLDVARHSEALPAGQSEQVLARRAWSRAAVPDPLDQGLHQPASEGLDPRAGRDRRRGQHLDALPAQAL